jgi:hypothetical protein
MTMCPVAAEKFCVDRRTDRHGEVNGHFSHFFNAPKMDCAEWGIWHEWGRGEVLAAFGQGTCRTETSTIHVKIFQAQF